MPGTIAKNAALFAGTSFLGVEALHMETTVAISLGLLIVLLRLSFQVGQFVNRFEEWRGRVDERLEKLETCYDTQKKHYDSGNRNDVGGSSIGYGM